MVIINDTVFSKKYIEEIRMLKTDASDKYKIFKVIYNGFGLIFLFVFIRGLVSIFLAKEDADVLMTIFYGIIAAVFLFIGMFWMDRSNRKTFQLQYKGMVGVKLHYEIDSEQIMVSDGDDESDYFTWDMVDSYQDTKDTFYLSLEGNDCLPVDKTGFTEGEFKDLLDLTKAELKRFGQDNGKADVSDKR